MTFPITRLNQTIQHTAVFVKINLLARILSSIPLVSGIVSSLFASVGDKPEHCQSESATCQSPTFCLIIFVATFFFKLYF